VQPTAFLNSLVSLSSGFQLPSFKPLKGAPITKARLVTNIKYGALPNCT
jgi:hypothetical protein